MSLRSSWSFFHDLKLHLKNMRLCDSLEKDLGKCTCLLRLTRQHKFKHIGCWLQDSVRIAHRRVRVLGTVRCDGGLSKIQSASNFICIKGLSLSLSPCYGMRFNSLFAPFEFLVHSVRSGGQDSMQHGTVVAWKKQLEYTAARSNIHWRSSQNVHKCGPIKPNTCTFFLHDERNPANLHAWEAFCCHTAGCHDATHVRPSCLGVPSIQGSPNYTNADGRMESKWKYLAMEMDVSVCFFPLNL